MRNFEASLPCLTDCEAIEVKRHTGIRGDAINKLLILFIAAMLACPTASAEKKDIKTALVFYGNGPDGDRLSASVSP